MNVWIGLGTRAHNPAVHSAHSIVPIKDKELRRWVEKQRANYEALSPDRRQLLRKLGFVQNTEEATWTRNYKMLVEFRRDNGHCNVPYNQNGLGNWVHNQLTCYDSLSPERKELLTKLNFLQDPVHVVNNSMQLPGVGPALVEDEENIVDPDFSDAPTDIEVTAVLEAKIQELESQKERLQLDLEERTTLSTRQNIYSLKKLNEVEHKKLEFKVKLSASNKRLTDVVDELEKTKLELSGVKQNESELKAALTTANETISVLSGELEKTKVKLSKAKSKKLEVVAASADLVKISFAFAGQKHKLEEEKEQAIAARTRLTRKWRDSAEINDGGVLGQSP
jgi:Helicase associated domain